jgi:hypothetical protein
MCSTLVDEESIPNPPYEGRAWGGLMENCFNPPLPPPSIRGENPGIEPYKEWFYSVQVKIQDD